MRKYKGSWTLLLALGLVAIPGTGRAQESRGQEPRKLPSPLEAPSDLLSAGQTIFRMVDANRDGLFSEKELIDANNRLAGSLFFQADADGNGAVSEEEVRAVRKSYLDQTPWLRYVVESVEAEQGNKQSSSQSDLLQQTMALLDTNGDRQIQAQELRQVVRTLTQTYFAFADTNQDGQMSLSEVNDALTGGLRMVAQLAFQQADSDNNGQLSRAEYDKALVEPANVAFQILDLNHDGQISQLEADQTQNSILTRLRMFQIPEPANRVESVKSPREVAPVPAFTTQNVSRDRQQPAQTRSQPAQTRSQPAQTRTQPGRQAGQRR